MHLVWYLKSLKRYRTWPSSQKVPWPSFLLKKTLFLPEATTVFICIHVPISKIIKNVLFCIKVLLRAVRVDACSMFLLYYWVLLCEYTWTCCVHSSLSDIPMFSEYLLPVCGFLVYFLTGVFWQAEVCVFDEMYQFLVL